MALAAPVLEQTYRYAFPSMLVGEGDRRRRRLARSILRRGREDQGS